MIRFKKLDRFILGKFVLIFVGAFFICLFIFMMQFTWKYVDDLVGKGLSLDVLARFFYYMGVTMVPTSLPLGVLLASLITFGNLGEHFELLAMKAAGVSLLRIMAPIFVFVIFLTGVSFYFQNYTSPDAQLRLRTLLFSMRTSSPAVEIPEGVFYTDKIPNINLYVQSKNADTGMLYQVIIYKTDQGFDRAQIVLADSGHLAVTKDKQHLKLRLWQGEMFENLQGQSTPGIASSGIPYDRETFIQKDFIIDFDSNFKEMDANQLSGMAQAKSMAQIEHSADSMRRELDSIGRAHFQYLKNTAFRAPKSTAADSQSAAPRQLPKVRSFDAMVAALPAADLKSAQQEAAVGVSQQRMDIEFRRDSTEETAGWLRRHWIEWHQKMTLSLACLMFFFVGAPLGGIIRKGGLGMPTVVSIAIFLVYHIINSAGLKLGRSGSINIAFGMWISTALLSPIGLFLTYKSNKDSVVFNPEAYQSFFRTLLGLRPKRYLTRKEVIIQDPDYPLALEAVRTIRQASQTIQQRYVTKPWVSYWQLYFRPLEDDGVALLAERIEAVVADLANSQHATLLSVLTNYPALFQREHLQVSRHGALNKLLGIVFPIGGLFWLRASYFQYKLQKNLRQVATISDQLMPLLEKEINHEL